MWPCGLYVESIKYKWTYKKIGLYAWFFQFFGCDEESIYDEAFMGLLRASFCVFYLYLKNEFFCM